MRSEKGWLQGQMRSAKREVGDWQGWKKDTIRKEISNQLSGESRRDSSIVVRSSGAGRLLVRDTKK
jgi:hypothetical protein